MRHYDDGMICWRSTTCLVDVFTGRHQVKSALRLVLVPTTTRKLKRHNSNNDSHRYITRFFNINLPVHIETIQCSICNSRIRVTTRSCLAGKCLQAIPRKLISGWYQAFFQVIRTEILMKNVLTSSNKPEWRDGNVATNQLNCFVQQKIGKRDCNEITWSCFRNSLQHFYSNWTMRKSAAKKCKTHVCLQAQKMKGQ